MAFFEHGSFSDANGRFYSNAPVSGAHDNGGTAVNITPAKAVGSFNIPLFGVFSSKKYSDVIEYNRYLSTLSSAPYLGLDNITPILLPLGSNKKLYYQIYMTIHRYIALTISSPLSKGLCTSDHLILLPLRIVDEPSHL